MAAGYRIFKRTWWKRNKAWPRGLEPHAGRKRTLGYADTVEEARRWCAEWNRNNAPKHNPLSLKAEFEKA